MCFNWPERAKTGQPDPPEHLVHRFGPIFAHAFCAMRPQSRIADRKCASTSTQSRRKSIALRIDILYLYD
jgi:hypothetical protein